jgi:hypothetical protein
VLDKRFFSSIIYILYEDGALRPPVVKRLKLEKITTVRLHFSSPTTAWLPSGRVTSPSGENNGEEG